MRLKLLLAGACLLPLLAREDDSGDILPNHKLEVHGGRGCPWHCTQRLGSDWMTHQAEVTCVAWSPDGSRIFSGGKDKVIRVWDAVTGRPAMHRQEDRTRKPLIFRQEGAVTALSLDPLGTQLIASGDSASIRLRLWEANTGKEMLWVKGVRTPVSETDLKTLSRKDYQHFGESYPTPPVTCLAWSPSGTDIAAGQTDGTINLWNPDYGAIKTREGGSVLTRQLDLGHKNGTVHALAWRGDGRAFCSGGADRTFRAWDSGSAKQLYRVEGFKNWVTAVAWSPDLDRIATGDALGMLQVWEASTGKPMLQLAGHKGSILAVAWSPDGKTLISAGEDASARSKTKDSAIHVWDAATGKEILQVHGHTRAITCLAFSHDGKRFCSGSADKTLRIWDLKTGKPDPDLETHHGTVHAVLWSRDGSRILSAGDDRTIRIWDPEHGGQAGVLEGHTSGVLSLALSPDGSRLASGGEDDTIRVWELKKGAQMLCIEGQRSAVTALAWSHGGEFIVSAGEDKALHIWRADSGAEARRITGAKEWLLAVAWSPDGKRLAGSARDGALRVWDPDSGKEICSLESHKRPLTALHWDSDSATLLFAGEDGALGAWNTTTGLEVRLTKNTARPLVSAPVLDPDGNPVKLEPLRYEDGISACGWSQDLKSAVTGNGEVAVLWNLGIQDPKAVDYYRGHHAPISACAWSPDGKTFATAGEDSRILVWTR